MKLFRFAIVLFLSLLAALTLASSSISGVVTAGGTSPAVKVANVQVQLIGARKPRLTCATTYTDSNGRYSFTNLPTGKYRAVFSKDNFLPAYMSYYELANNVGVQLNATMVPYLAETEIEKPRESQESFDIYNPNRFSVSYTWKSFRSKNQGSGVAAPGHSNLVVPKPIPERVMLFVGGVHDQPCGYSLVPPPLVVNKVSGSVLTGGIALPGATVTMADLSGDIDDTAVTDINGAYTFYNTPNGVYTLTFTDDGYTTATKNIEVTGMPLVVPPVTLSASATVTIQVLNGSGFPVSNASVTISYAEGNSVQGHVDGLGDVTFSNQSANVTATVTANALDGSGRFVTQTTSFNPGPNNLTLTLGGTPATLDVTVLDANGSPVSGCTVMATVGSNSQSSGTDQTGLAHITGLTTGNATIFVFTADGSNRQSTTTQVLNAGANTDTVILPLVVTSLTVHVSDQFQQPQVGAKVVLAYQDGTVVDAFADANGDATLTGLQGNSEVLITATSADGTLGNSENLFIGNGNNSTTLFLISVFASATVLVELGDGTSLDFTTVSLVDSGGNVLFTASSGLTGAANFPNELPANTPLTAQITYLGQTYSTPIDPIPAAGSRGFLLQLPKSDVTINVSDANGVVGGATVLITYSSDGGGTYALTDQNGNVELPCRAGDGVTITATSPNGAEIGSIGLFNGFTVGSDNVSLFIN